MSNTERVSKVNLIFAVENRLLVFAIFLAVMWVMFVPPGLMFLVPHLQSVAGSAVTFVGGAGLLVIVLGLWLLADREKQEALNEAERERQDARNDAGRKLSGKRSSDLVDAALTEKDGQASLRNSDMEGTEP